MLTTNKKSDNSRPSCSANEQFIIFSLYFLHYLTFLYGILFLSFPIQKKWLSTLLPSKKSFLSNQKGIKKFD